MLSTNPENNRYFYIGIVALLTFLFGKDAVLGIMSSIIPYIPAR